MNDPSICYLSVAQASKLLQRRELSPEFLTQAFLDRIALLNPSLRAYITVTEGTAMAQAHRVSTEIAQGRQTSPCCGVQVSYKDLIETAGIRTTSASRIYEGFIPGKDANVVTRLNNSGAITLGKATLNEFAFGGVSEDDFIKPARNPWKLTCPTGLSSSGSAVGVAAGLAMASIGTDSGGSVRIPASYCGVVGLKPTYGLIGRTGVFPLSYSLDHIGIIARTVLDTALLLEILAGYDAGDSTSSPSLTPPYTSFLGRDLRGKRIGVLRGYMERVGVDDQVLNAFESVLKEFRSLGAVVREVTVPSLSYAPAANFTILRIEGFRVHLRNLRDRRYEYGKSTFDALGAGGLLTANDYIRAQQARTLISQELAQVFREVDVLATPTTPSTACGGRFDSMPSTDHRIAKSSLSYVAPFDLTGSPAVSICCGFTVDGLPIGLQLIGRAFDEGNVLGIAHSYQEVTDFHRRRPSV